MGRIYIMGQTLKNVLVVRSAITAEQFRRFSYFNGLILKRRYLGLIAFAVLLAVFGWCNLITGSKFLFWLFVGTGLLVPGIYLMQFRKSIRAQIKRLNLNESPCEAYTVGLNQKGIYIERSGEHLSFDWETLHSAHRVGSCTYLYYAPQRALILPDDCIFGGGTNDASANASPEDLWTLFQEHMPQKSLKKWRILL